MRTREAKLSDYNVPKEDESQLDHSYSHFRLGSPCIRHFRIPGRMAQGYLRIVPDTLAACKAH